MRQQELVPDRCKFYFCAVALKKLGFVIGFYFMNMLCYRRLRNKQFFCRFGKIQPAVQRCRILLVENRTLGQSSLIPAGLSGSG